MGRRWPWLLALGAAAAQAAPAEGAGAEAHWWPHSRGRVGHYGVSEFPGPKNFTAQLAWDWQHPTYGIVTSALLDSERNVYVSAMDGIRKFTPDGSLIWHWQPDFGQPTAFGEMLPLTVTTPVLVGDSIFTSTVNGWLARVSMDKGRTVWSVRLAKGAEMDTPYVEAENGVVMQIFEKMKDHFSDASGNRLVVAANATDGSKLWEYMSDTVLWNFQPQFLGDGTFLVMDIHGGVRRLATLTGEALAYVPPPDPWMQYTFTDGGLILDPGAKIAYTCSNLGSGTTDSAGILRAYKVSDLQLLWQQVLPQPCVSWPASNGRTVVVPIGALPSVIPYYLLERWLPNTFKSMLVLLSNWLGDAQNLIWRIKPRPMLVMAFDAQTGSPQWVFDRIKPWPRDSSMGDAELILPRSVHFPSRPVCGPASWSSPTFDRDGTVYAGGMNGILYAIRDANSDGAIDDAEVSTLDLGAASLHQGASFAPGMMTYASCTGVYVFKT